jgi:hypothetical protein
MPEPLPLELQADELIRAVQAGEKIPLDILRSFILKAHSQHDANRTARAKEEAKKGKNDPIDFF